VNKRIKIGILLTDLGGMDVRALKYLLVFQNTIQTSFEFRLMPYDKDNPLFYFLNSNTYVSRSEVIAEGDLFIKKYQFWLEEYALNYGLECSYPDGVVILSTCKLADYYYAIGGDGWDIVALGNWKRFMAPPSIVEFFLTLALRATIDVACGEPYPKRHQSLKGCVFDFNASIDEARYSVLSGYLCDSCCERISSVRSEEVVEDIQLLLSKNWLGDALEPTMASNNVKKLGYDLFHTTGLKPTFKERILAAAEKEAIANIFKLFGGIVLAGLLVWLGLKN
jgi:hypothetical protein